MSGEFWPADLVAWSKFAQSSITALAIIIGGIWTYVLFIQKRQRYPRLNVSHQVISWPVGQKNLIRLQVRIENLGDVLFRLSSGHVWIQLMRPWPNGVQEADRGMGGIRPAERKAEWPILQEHAWDKIEKEVEPRETDTLHFNFMVNRQVKTIIAHTYLRNETKSRWFDSFTSKPRTIGWNTDSVHDLQVDEQERRLMSEDKSSKDRNRNKKSSGNSDSRQGPPKERPSTDQLPDSLKDSGD